MYPNLADGFDSAADSSDSFRLKLDSIDAATKQIRLELNFLHAGKKQAPGREGTTSAQGKRRDNKHRGREVGVD